MLGVSVLNPVESSKSYIQIERVDRSTTGDAPLPFGLVPSAMIDKMKRTKIAMILVSRFHVVVAMMAAQMM